MNPKQRAEALRLMPRLSNAISSGPPFDNLACEVVILLRELLAEPAQEPVARLPMVCRHSDRSDCALFGAHDSKEAP